jgi:CRP/FNR family transcriptional regulator, cyclic AMP receptor protein
MSSATYRTKSWPVGPTLPSAARSRRIALEERQQLLSRSSLFSGLAKRQLRSIARTTTVSHHPAGTSIVRAGEPGSTFFAIIEGEAKVVRRGLAPRRLGPGEFFGEIAILDPGPRTASVLAESDTTCLQLGTREFFAVVTTEPLLAERILKTLAGRLRQAEPKELS